MRRVRKFSTATAGILISLANILAKVSDLLFLVLLARLLSPEDFGLIAFSVTIIVVVETILNVPIGTGIVRADEVTPQLCHTAFTLAVIRALLLMSVVVGLSEPLSVVYEDHRLILILTTLSVSPFLRSLISPVTFVLNRSLDFRPTTMGLSLGKALGLVFGCILVLTTHSYWSYVVYHLTASMTILVASYSYAPYKPRFTLSEFKAYRDIVGWSTLNQLLSALNWKSDQLVLAGFVAPSVFGKYSMAVNIASTPNQIFAKPFHRPITAGLSQYTDIKSLGEKYLQASQGMMLVAAPALILLGVYSEQVVLILFGSDWINATQMLRCSSLVALVIIPTITFSPAMTILRRIYIVSCVGLTEMALRVLMLFLFVKYAGVYGAIIATGIASTFRLVTVVALCKKVLCLSYSTQFDSHKRNLISGFLLLLFSLFCEEKIINENGISYIVQTVVCVLASLVFYILISLLLWKMAGKPSGAEAIVLRVSAAAVRSLKTNMSHSRWLKK